MSEHESRPDSDAPEPGLLADTFQTRYREVTLLALVFAVIVGVIMNAAITYAGLKIGFTIGGSAIAAVLGFGVLRGVLRRGTILETNVAQTVASAVNTSNSGIIFTVPVLFLLGYQLTMGTTDFWLVAFAGVAGAFLGTAFIIPLRKQMIDIERLRFPSPTGVAMILKSPGAGAAKAVVLLVGILLGALIYLPAGLPALTSPADTEELVELFEEGRISWDAVESTRTLAGWVEAEAVPDEIDSAVTAAADADALQSRLTDAEAADPGLAAAAAAALEAAEEEAANVGVPMDVLLAVAKARDGEGAWSALRRTSGWAQAPMFGYSDLGLRLGAEPADPETPHGGQAPADLDGDGQVDERLSTRVDRDGDGRPDLLVTDTTIDVGRAIGLPDDIQFMIAIAPFALGAGYITGKAGLFVLAGGILAFFVLNPAAAALGWVPATLRPDQVPGFAFGAFNRPLGIGLLLGGALMGVLSSLPAIKEALKSIAAAGAVKGGGEELGFKTLLITATVGLVVLFGATYMVTTEAFNPRCPVTDQPIVHAVGVEAYQGYSVGFADDASRTAWQGWDDAQRDAFMATLNAKPGLLAAFPPVIRALIVALIGAAWIWFAGIIIAQCAGMTDWSPISGLALLTVVLVMLLAGTGFVVGAVLIGAALCVAITLAADMMGDLKTGYLVGAKPRRQQVCELLTVWIGPIVCMLTIGLIVQSNMKQFDIPIGPGTPTVAPQAQALQAVITGVQGGQMPYALYGLGAGLGMLLGLGAFAGLGVLVGLSMYLPFMYISTYGIGCLINLGVAKVKGRAWAEEWGVPMAAGLIVGESLLALAINGIVLLSG